MFNLVLTVGRHLVSGLGCGILLRHRGNGSSPRQRVPMESEPDASDFSSESSSSFEFSLSNSVDSDELVSVDSTIEPYQFETVGASTSHASDSDGDDGKPGKGRLESTNWYVYNGNPQISIGSDITPFDSRMLKVC